MYMREMGSVELLTREGEIEIAKRIEDGLKHMIQAISACPTTIAEILRLAEKIEKRRDADRRSGRRPGRSQRRRGSTTTWPRRRLEDEFDEEDDEDEDGAAALTEHAEELKARRARALRHDPPRCSTR